MTHVGDAIRASREAMGLSQEAVAARIEGMTREYLSQIESGRTKWPESYIGDLEHVLDISPSSLILERFRDINEEAQPVRLLESQPQERTRVLFDQTIKEGWRVKELSIELDGHPDPVHRTAELFEELRTVAENAAKRANTTRTSNPFA